MPKVSVLMTNYNGGAFIEEAIESILNQTYIDFEFIIVDDGSTDSSWSIIQDFAQRDTRILCYQNTENRGISLTRNRLIDLALGEYIAWLDSDDRARSDRLEKQVQFLESHPQYGIVGSWLNIIDRYGKNHGIKKLPIGDTLIKKQLFLRNSMNNPSLMIRKACFRSMGKYDENLSVAEDYDFIVRVGIKYKFANIPEILTEYRMHDTNISQKKYREMVFATLLIRKKMVFLGYRMNILDYVAYYITWCVQYISPCITQYLFHFFIRLLPIRKRT